MNLTPPDPLYVCFGLSSLTLESSVRATYTKTHPKYHKWCSGYVSLGHPMSPSATNISTMGKSRVASSYAKWMRGNYTKYDI